MDTTTKNIVNSLTKDFGTFGSSVKENPLHLLKASSIGALVFGIGAVCYDQFFPTQKVKQTRLIRKYDLNVKYLNQIKSTDSVLYSFSKLKGFREQFPDAFDTALTYAEAISLVYLRVTNAVDEHEDDDQEFISDLQGGYRTSSHVIREHDYGAALHYLHKMEKALQQIYVETRKEDIDVFIAREQAKKDKAEREKVRRNALFSDEDPGETVLKSRKLTPEEQKEEKELLELHLRCDTVLDCMTIIVAEMTKIVSNIKMTVTEFIGTREIDLISQKLEEMDEEDSDSEEEEEEGETDYEEEASGDEDQEQD